MSHFIAMGDSFANHRDTKIECHLTGHDPSRIRTIVLAFNLPVELALQDVARLQTHIGKLKDIFMATSHFISFQALQHRALAQCYVPHEVKDPGRCAPSYILRSQPIAAHQGAAPDIQSKAG